MTVSAAAHARSLYDARRTGRPVDPITDALPDLDIRGAYAIQSELVRMLIADGDAVTGYKVGLTSKPMQRQLGVDSPDFAPVLASTVYESGATIELDWFIQPRVEAEIIYVLDDGLRGPNVTSAVAARAVRGVVAGLEIIDSRIDRWRIKLADTVADLASCGAVVLGSNVAPVTDFDARLVGLTVTRNGELADTGAGAAALGDPIRVLAWLANTLAIEGVSLEPGHFVLSGSLHAAIPLAPGDVFRAEFDRLGSVTVKVAAR
jgi:2-keto-4-pentenoate hydratase